MQTDLIVIGLCAALIILDIVSGLIKAAKEGDISSKIMREGLYHKSAYIIVITLGYVIEYASTFIDLGFELPIVFPIIGFIMLTEIVSIFENVTKINPDLTESSIAKLFKKE